MTTTILLGNISMFTGLAPAVLAPLQAACHSVKLEKDEVLFQFGSKGREMYIIESGKIRIWIPAPDGHEVVLAEFGPDQVIGELEMIDGKPRSASATAMEFTRLIALPRDALFQQLGQNPGMALHIMTVLSERLRASNAQHMEIRANAAPVPKRVAHLLLLMAENDLMTIKKFRVEDIALTLGIAPDILHTLLEEWTVQGIVSSPTAGELAIQQPGALHQLAERAETPVG